MTPKTDAPQNAAFSVTANTQLCSDDGCAPPVPSQTEISLAAGDGAPAADWDSAALQSVAGITPAPEGLIATQTEKDVTITFPAGSVPTVAHFFSDDNCVTPTAEQKIDPATGSLTIARNDDKAPMHPTKDHNMVGKPLSKVSGMLVADDKAYEISPATVETPLKNSPDAIRVRLSSLSPRAAVASSRACVQKSKYRM